MKLIAVTRTWNDDDVIEAMIRHTANLVDMHLVLDTGSADHTVEILRNLRTEGLNLQVFENTAVLGGEEHLYTILYRLAHTAHGADWVLPLAAHDFLDPGKTADLRSTLADIPAETPCVAARQVTYVAATPLSRDERNVARRLTRRAKAPEAATQVILRGGFPDASLTLGAGNHSIVLDGKADHGVPIEGLALGRFPVRSPWQFAAATIAENLRRLAAGGSEPADQSGLVEDLRQRPQFWLSSALDHAQRAMSDPALTEDPFDYRGGTLFYTDAPAYEWRALRTMLPMVERLAAAHGAVLDRNEAIREKATRELYSVRLIVA